jgi:hypothetical protein
MARDRFFVIRTSLLIVVLCALLLPNRHVEKISMPSFLSTTSESGTAVLIKPSSSDTPPTNTMPPIKFWMVWTKGPENWNWLFNGVIAALLANHPNSTLRMLSTQLPLDFFDCYAQEGYDISVMRYNLTDLARGSESAEKLVASGKIGTSNYKVAHESDVVRLLILREYGGTYIDTDMLFLKPLDYEIVSRSGVGIETTMKASTGSKAASFHDESARRINNAIIHIARPHDPFMECMVSELWRRYKPEEWASIGPDLTGACYDRLLAGRPAVITDEEAAHEFEEQNKIREIKKKEALDAGLPFFGRRNLRRLLLLEDDQTTSTTAATTATSTDDLNLIPQLYPREYFYPLDWRFAWYANRRDILQLQTFWEVNERVNTYAFHLYNSHSHAQLEDHRKGGGYTNTGGPQPGSWLASVLEKFPVPQKCKILEVNTGKILTLIPLPGEEKFS